MLLHPPPMKSACSSSSTARVIGQKEACHGWRCASSRALHEPAQAYTGCAGFYASAGRARRRQDRAGQDASASTCTATPAPSFSSTAACCRTTTGLDALVGAPPMYVGYEEPGSAAKKRAAEKERRLWKKLQAKNIRSWRPSTRPSTRASCSPVRTSSSRAATPRCQAEHRLHRRGRQDERACRRSSSSTVWSTASCLMSDNEIVDVSDVVFIIAGNHGSTNVVVSASSPWLCRTPREARRGAMPRRGQIKNAMKERHRPEFLDRIDEIIFFNKLQPRRPAQAHHVVCVSRRWSTRYSRGACRVVPLSRCRWRTAARDFIFGRGHEENGNARRIGRMVQAALRPTSLDSAASPSWSTTLESCRSPSTTSSRSSTHGEGAPALDCSTCSKTKGVARRRRHGHPDRPDTSVSRAVPGPRAGSHDPEAQGQG
jgi:hypothetical protein